MVILILLWIVLITVELERLLRRRRWVPMPGVKRNAVRWMRRDERNNNRKGFLASSASIDQNERTAPQRGKQFIGNLVHIRAQLKWCTGAEIRWMCSQTLRENKRIQFRTTIHSYDVCKTISSLNIPTIERGAQSIRLSSDRIHVRLFIKINK